MPDQPMLNHLARKISRLSRQLSTPCFEPHITLLSRIILPEVKALEKSEKLVRHLRPFRIELADIAHLDDFFRCIFVTVRPNVAVFRARRAACKVFVRQRALYLPHVSLVYGRFLADRRKEIARGLSPLPAQAFYVRKIALYRVKGPARLWKSIEQFDLK